jgi:hypothetical protein
MIVEADHRIGQHESRSFASMAYSIQNDLRSDEGLRHTFGYLLPAVSANATITYGEIAAKLADDLQITGKARCGKSARHALNWTPP